MLLHVNGVDVKNVSNLKSVYKNLIMFTESNLISELLGKNNKLL